MRGFELTPADLGLTPTPKRRGRPPAAKGGALKRWASTSTALASAWTMGTWRVTQGIYRVDPNLYPALIATPAAEA